MIKYFLLVAVALFGFAACDSTTESPAGNDAEMLVAPSEVGVYHNAGLDFARSYIESETKSLGKTGRMLTGNVSRDLLTIVEESCFQFAESVVAEQATSAPGTEEAMRSACTAGATESMGKTGNQYSDNMSAEQARFVELIYDVVEDAGRQGLSDIDSEISDLLADAKKSLPSDELYLVESAASVAAHTYVYWGDESNVRDWLNVVSDFKAQYSFVTGVPSSEIAFGKQKALDLDAIRRDDVKGGVAGAFTGITMSFGTLGASIAMGALIGSVGGSTGELIAQGWDML
jgi:hypothetical protein